MVMKSRRPDFSGSLYVRGNDRNRVKLNTVKKRDRKNEF